MFCTNCGNKIKEEDAVFCSNCGARLKKINEPKSDSYGKPDVINTLSISQKKVKMPVSKKKAAILAVAGIAAAMAVVTFSNRKITIDMNQIYDIEASGYDGAGTVEVTFDYKKFEEKYDGKLQLDKKSAKKWVKKEYEDVDEAKEAYETLCSYDDMTAHIADLLYYYCQDIETSQNYDLQNGDTVEFTCDDGELIDTIEDLYNCKIKELKKYKVEGLERFYN